MRLDAATGLYYTPNRDYDTATGTWREADPAQCVIAQSLYGAEVSNPSSRRDATGLNTHATDPLTHQPGVKNTSKRAIIVERDTGDSATPYEFTVLAQGKRRQTTKIGTTFGASTSGGKFVHPQCPRRMNI